MTVTGAEFDLAGDQVSRVRMAVPPEPPTTRVALEDAPTVRLGAPSPARSGSVDGSTALGLMAPEPATVHLRPRPLRYVPLRHGSGRHGSGRLRPARADRTRALLVVVATLGTLLAVSLVFTVLAWR